MSDLLSSQLVQAGLAAELREARLELAKIKSDLQVSQRERREESCSCSILKSAPVKEWTKEKKRLNYDASLEVESPPPEAFQNEGDIEWSTTPPADDDIEDGDGWGSEFLSATPSNGDSVQQGVHSDVKEAETVPKMLSELADMINKERDVFQQWRWF